MNQVIIAFFLSLMLFCLGGCNAQKEARNLRQVTVEGCQYFYISSLYGDSMCHKGNCTNCWARIEKMHKKE